MSQPSSSSSSDANKDRQKEQIKIAPPKTLTSRDRDYLARALATTTEFRQLSTEWKGCITQGASALKSARTSVVRAMDDLTTVLDQLQDIVTRMNRIRQRLIALIQQASPPGIMGIDAIIKAQEEARIAAELEAQRKAERSDSSDSSDSDDSDDSDDNNDNLKEEGDTTEEAPSTPVTRGYVPPPYLIHTHVPGTLATPLDCSTYTEHVFEQALDEIGLKEGILEALQTIGDLKDSGADELPSLLDQQLTNMVLLWELEPYTETVPERNTVEEALGVVAWQMENVK